ncbi:MAG: hypothetical protein CBC25_05840 [Pelagibacteraceae bacterium TMED65]|nr:MAG: hypothetical protein CBC25_05840 [Pelagibacteraceae bacterium TMED65]|tara:strand:+ start:2448 stop:4169 length:1722 start_codon:yes stop_codon:yes gene_type:complete
MLLFKRINNILLAKHKSKISLLILLIFFGSLVELLGFGILIPFIAIILDSEKNFSFLNFQLFQNTEFDNLVIIFCVSILALYFLKSLYLTFLSYKQSRTIYNLVNDISNNLLSYYINKQYDQQILENSSNKIRNLQTEVNGLCITFINQILFLINDILVITLIITTVFLINPYGAATAIFVFGISALILDVITKNKITSLSQKRHKANSDTIRILNDIFRGIREIKSRNFEKYFINIFNKSIITSSNSNATYDVFVKIPRFWLEFIAVVSIFSFLIINHLFINGDIVSSLTIFGLAFVKLLPNISRLSSSINVLRYSFISFKSIEKELIHVRYNKVPISKKSKTKILSKFKEIEFKDVSFKYPQKSEEVLKNLNLIIKKNDCIGIYGQSGSGKTTFLDTLMGLLMPYNGDVLINGLKLNDKISHGWRNKISYVPQEIFLIDDTIKNNLTLFGKSNTKKINEIISKLNLKLFVDSQEAKLNTNIGERGMKLSGGQRQRIGIARGFLDNSDILIFDESTSALDIENEDRFLNLIKDNKKLKTIIIVSHKKRLFKHCNKIFKFSKGKLQIEKVAIK